MKMKKIMRRVAHDGEGLRRGRRVTPQEHEKYSKALDGEAGMDRPRAGRPAMAP